MADKLIYWSKTTLTGGGATALDSIDGTGLQDGEVNHVFLLGVLYLYRLNATLGGAESSPSIIAPDTNAGDKRWELMGIYVPTVNGLTLVAASTGFTIAGGTTPKTLTLGANLTVTGAATIDRSSFDPASPGTIGDTTAGYLQALTRTVYKTATADSPLTALQCSRTIVSNYNMTDADCAILLPNASEGLFFVNILPTVRARYWHLVAGGSDKIYLNGVAGGGGGFVGVSSGYATGTAASFWTFKASDGGFDWFSTPIFGTWVAG